MLESLLVSYYIIIFISLALEQIYLLRDILVEPGQANRYIHAHLLGLVVLDCNDFLERLLYIEIGDVLPQLVLVQLTKVKHVVDYEDKELRASTHDFPGEGELIPGSPQLLSHQNWVQVLREDFVKPIDDVLQLNALAVDGIDGSPHLMRDRGVDEGKQLLLSLRLCNDDLV